MCDVMVLEGLPCVTHGVGGFAMCDIMVLNSQFYCFSALDL